MSAGQLLSQKHEALHSNNALIAQRMLEYNQSDVFRNKPDMLIKLLSNIMLNNKSPLKRRPYHHIPAFVILCYNDQAFNMKSHVQPLRLQIWKNRKVMILNRVLSVEI